MIKYFIILLCVGVFLGCSSAREEEKKVENSEPVELKVEKKALLCEYENKAIKCTLNVERKEYPRGVDFYWKSPNSPSDDRNHSNVLAKNHGSIFDGRYGEGRAKGEWRVKATIENEEYITAFIIE